MNPLIKARLTVHPAPNEAVRNVIFVQDSWHPTQSQKGLRNCGNPKSLGGVKTIQYPQPHLVSRTDQFSAVKVHDDDCENANDSLERVLAPPIKETKRNLAVRHRNLFSCRDAQQTAQLRAVIDTAIKQHDY